jgi:hypothetical protein
MRLKQPITVITVSEAQRSGAASSHSTLSPAWRQSQHIDISQFDDVDLQIKTRLFLAKACSVPQG